MADDGSVTTEEYVACLERRAGRLAALNELLQARLRAALAQRAPKRKAPKQEPTPLRTEAGETA